MPSSGLTCIVDDNADYRLILNVLFQRWFPAYPTRFFSSGQSLLDALPQLRPLPSLILLDRHMPDLDGHQTLVLIKQQVAHKRIPVVMMSAGSSIDEIDNCYDAGANSFLLKTIDLISQKAAIEAICGYWVDLNQAPSAAIKP